MAGVVEFLGPRSLRKVNNPSKLVWYSLQAAQSLKGVPDK